MHHQMTPRKESIGKDGKHENEQRGRTVDELARIGGVRREELDGRFRFVEERLQRLDNFVCGNGKPGLEERVIGFVDVRFAELAKRIEAVKDHAKGNMQQGDGELLAIIRTETQDRKDQHRENKEAREEEKKERKEFEEKVDKRMSRVEKAIYIGFGAIIMLKFLGIDNLFHVIK